jgi:hypothetical protein
LTITWFDNSNNETSFKIERAGPDLAFQQITTVRADTWFYTDNTVTPSTPYWYRVRASNASGDSGYSNVIVANSTLIYSGTIGSDPFAVVVDALYRGGTFYAALSSKGEILVLPFAFLSNGEFSVSGQAVSVGTNPRATERRTIRGRIEDGTLTATIDDRALAFSAKIQPLTGPTASLLGVYSANPLLSASGTTYLVVDAQGRALVLSIDPSLATFGTGTIASDGSFSIQTPLLATIEGNASGDTKLLHGVIRFPTRPDMEILGTEVHGVRTEQLINLSSRVRVGSDAAQALVSGFVVGGEKPKRMLLRAIGPGLGFFGVQETLPNPHLRVFDQSGQLVAQNDDWENQVDVRTVGDRLRAFELTPNGLDSALLATFAPGVYTMQVDSNDVPGVVLGEIYDADEALDRSSLLNISTRGQAAAGEGAIISGFVVSGKGATRVLVRGVGPALESFGIAGSLRDPVLRIHQGSVLIAENDNWETPRPVLSRSVQPRLVKLLMLHYRRERFQSRLAAKTPPSSSHLPLALTPQL